MSDKLELPNWLLRPVKLQVLSYQEAAGLMLWQEYQNNLPELVNVPDYLAPAAGNLWLLELPCSRVRH